MRIEILANFSLQKEFLKKFMRFNFRPENIMSSYYEIYLLLLTKQWSGMILVPIEP